MNRFQHLRLRRVGFPLVTVALAAVALTVGLGGSASATTPTYTNDFESNTDGWFVSTGGTIAREPSGFTNPGGYANGISSAGGGFHARLDRTADGSCFEEAGGGGPTVHCYGPFTRWGGYNDTFPAGGYTTQLDIYLDAAYATANPDSYGGNIACLVGNAADTGCNGTRFDYTSAINDTSGSHLRDFGFNVSTGLVGDTCPGFMVVGTTNVDRVGANPNSNPDAKCIANSGWYTFRHTFTSKNGYLDVLMQIFPKGSSTPVASWDITGIDPDGTYGCNRYGWFSNQEIWGLPIDNASMTGCGTPAPPVVVEPPTVIVLPNPPGSGPPTPATPPLEKLGDVIVAKMKKKQLSSCLIEVRSLGSRRILVARGAAHAPATGTSRMVIRVRVQPKGAKLLEKNFGGVIVNVRALCRTTTGATRAGVRRVRAILWIEHALTPPGSWVPDQPILTDIGLRFMQHLRSHMRFARLIKCEGYTATYPPSPAFPPVLSLNRAQRVCSELKRTAGSTSAHVKLVPHGLTNPIATNSNEAGRRVNRRVFVTVVHFRVLRG